jgi:integrase
VSLRSNTDPTCPGTASGHVAASALIAQGASVGHLSCLLGHASLAITLRVYAHEFAAAEHADRTRKRMETAFGDLLR